MLLGILCLLSLTSQKKLTDTCTVVNHCCVRVEMIHFCKPFPLRLTMSLQNWYPVEVFKYSKFQIRLEQCLVVRYVFDSSFWYLTLSNTQLLANIRVYYICLDSYQLLNRLCPQNSPPKSACHTQSVNSHFPFAAKRVTVEKYYNIAQKNIYLIWFNTQSKIISPRKFTLLV